MTRNPKPDVYMNARGEVVMTYAAFKAATFEAIWKHLNRKGSRS